MVPTDPLESGEKKRISFDMIRWNPEAIKDERADQNSKEVHLKQPKTLNIKHYSQLRSSLTVLLGIRTCLSLTPMRFRSRSWRNLGEKIWIFQIRDRTILKVRWTGKKRKEGRKENTNTKRVGARRKTFKCSTLNSNKTTKSQL